MQVVNNAQVLKILQKAAKFVGIKTAAYFDLFQLINNCDSINLVPAQIHEHMYTVHDKLLSSWHSLTLRIKTDKNKKSISDNLR